MAKIWTSSAVFVLESVIGSVSMSSESMTPSGIGFALGIAGAIPVAIAWADRLMGTAEDEIVAT